MHLTRNHPISLSRSNLIFYGIAVGVLTLYNLTPRWNAFDTYYYLIAGERLWHGEMDCLRTPVYPLLLQFCKVCFGDRGMGAAITMLQSVVYLLSIVAFRRVARRCIQHQIVREAVAYLYVLAVAPSWCNVWMTESLSISGCIILVDILLRYIEKPSIALATTWGIVLLLLVFLRPTFVLFFAVLPCLWLWQWWQHRAAWRWHIAALGITLAVMACFGLYCKSYEQHFGYFSASFSTHCDLYSLKNSGAWDLAAVCNPEARALLQDIDEHFTINYAPVYDAISQSPTAYPLIAEGCNNMVQAHRKQVTMYRINLILNSFNERFWVAIYTHPLVGAILYASTLFLAPSLWLFYIVCLASGIYITVTLWRKHSTPPLYTYNTIYHYVSTMRRHPTFCQRTTWQATPAGISLVSYPHRSGYRESCYPNTKHL